MRFTTKHSVVGRSGHGHSCREIELEPMLFSADFAFANAHGGPITRAFLNRLAEVCEQEGVNITSVVIDSRVHMLMRGMYPCIPGWHHDDVPREGARNQPVYTNPAYRSEHLTQVHDAIDGRTWSMPEFMEGTVDVPWPLPDSAVVYNVWDAHISALPGITTVPVKSGDFVRFRAHDFHRGMPATSQGWRWFARASWSTGRTFENKIRKNANVYLPCSTVGW